MKIIRPTTPQFTSMMEFRLHDSLAAGLVTAGAIVIGQPLDSKRLDQWADGCDNPSGQRAALARCLARFTEVAGAEIIDAPDKVSATFWEATAR